MRQRVAILVVTMLLTLGAVTGPGSHPAVAQSGSDYHLIGGTSVGGGGAFTHGVYSLLGTAGQPGVGVLTGEGYTLVGGFWSGRMATAQSRIYLPLVLRESP